MAAIFAPTVPRYSTLLSENMKYRPGVNLTMVMNFLKSHRFLGESDTFNCDFCMVRVTVTLDFDTRRLPIPCILFITPRGICLILDTQKGNFAIKILVDKQMKKKLAETFLGAFSKLKLPGEAS
jgi:hypothetical protein